MLYLYVIMLRLWADDIICVSISSPIISTTRKSWMLKAGRTQGQPFKHTPTTGSWTFSLKDKQRKGGRHAYRRTKGAEAWGGKGGDKKHTEPEDAGRDWRGEAEEAPPYSLNDSGKSGKQFFLTRDEKKNGFSFGVCHDFLLPLPRHNARKASCPEQAHNANKGRQTTPIKDNKQY